MLVQSPHDQLQLRQRSGSLPVHANRQPPLHLDKYRRRGGSPVCGVTLYYDSTPLDDDDGGGDGDDDQSSSNDDDEEEEEEDQRLGLCLSSNNRASLLVVPSKHSNSNSNSTNSRRGRRSSLRISTHTGSPVPKPNRQLTSYDEVDEDEEADEHDQHSSMGTLHLSASSSDLLLNRQPHSRHVSSHNDDDDDGGDDVGKCAVHPTKPAMAVCRECSDRLLCCVDCDGKDHHADHYVIRFKTLAANLGNILSALRLVVAHHSQQILRLNESSVQAAVAISSHPVLDAQQRASLLSQAIHLVRADIDKHMVQHASASHLIDHIIHLETCDMTAMLRVQDRYDQLYFSMDEAKPISLAFDGDMRPLLLRFDLDTNDDDNDDDVYY